MDKENEKIIKNLRNVLADKDSKSLLKLYLKESKKTFSLKRFLIILTIYLILLIPIFNIACSENTIPLFLNIIDSSNTVFIAILAAMFTGYSLFQALMSGNTLKKMLCTEIDDMSMFKKYNIFFFGTSVLYLCIIILNFILKNVLNSIPKNYFVKFFTNWENAIFTFLFISVYMLLNIYSLLETKSFFYNIYQCFTTNAFANISESIKNDNIESDNNKNIEILNENIILLSKELETLTSRVEKAETKIKYLEDLKNKIQNAIRNM